MRLIRRPWKGCRFWDVPFTIPWKGCKFQKWGFPKWGYRIWNFRFFNVLHMEEAQVAYVVVWSSRGGWGGMLTFVSSASLTVRKRHMLHLLSYDRQGGWGGMFTFVSSTSFTLQKRLPLLTSCIVWRAFCGFPAWTYVGRGWISSKTIIAGTQQLDGTWKHLKKWRPQSMLHKKKQQVYQKRYSYAYSWTWRHNAALLQTVASALPQALWHR